MEKQSSHKLLVTDEDMKTQIKYHIEDNVLDCYLLFLSTIAIDIKRNNNIEINKRKFDEVLQDLLEFIKQHIYLVTIKNFTVKTKTKDMAEFNFGFINSADKFIDFENFANFVVDLVKIYERNSCTANFMVATYEPSGYVPFLEQVFGKPNTEITHEDMLNFENISCLTDQKWKNTKCSYAELTKKLNRRCNDFNDRIISTERIEELSFTFDETTEHIVADKECSICKDNYETGQLLCKMPCNHFFHRHCIEGWFKPQNSRLEDSDSEDSSSSDESESDIPENELEDVESMTNEEINGDSVISSDNGDHVISDESSTNEFEREIMADDMSDIAIRFSRDPPAFSIQYDESYFEMIDNNIEEDEILESDIEQDEITDYEIQEDEIPNYDIEEDVPATPKCHCPNCRHNCS